jgi:hypothetical protein
MIGYDDFAGQNPLRGTFIVSKSESELPAPIRWESGLTGRKGTESISDGCMLALPIERNGGVYPYFRACLVFPLGVIVRCFYHAT